MHNLDCKFCNNCKEVRANGGFVFFGCYHKPYKGKWIAEIKDCPLEQEAKYTVQEAIRKYIEEDWVNI